MASTIHADVRKTIETYMNSNWSYTSVGYINSTLDTDGLSEYITITIRPVDSEQVILGQPLNLSDGQRRDYVLFFQIFTDLGGGSGRAYELADFIEDLFNMKTLPTLEGRKIEFLVPRPPDSEGDVSDTNQTRKGWFQVNMDCPFFVRK